MTTFPSPVPKPTSAGQGQLALARTQAPYINLRNGPGTNYRDIGDIRNNTVLVHYPASRTREGWVWIEQGTVGGWVSSGVIGFENIAAPAPIPPQQATPYDGKIAVWHWKGDVLPENTIEDVVRNIKTVAPNVSQMWIKICDATTTSGAQWQGFWDTKRALAIDGPQSIDRWVQVLSRYGMEFHAWAVPKGTHVEAETNIMIQACTRPGVKSLILDVEPYDGFWQGGRDGVRPYMTRLRRALPGSFHIGMSVDPRKHHYASIFPQEWFPFVNSIHPQDYWATFRRPPEEVLQETYEVWGSYGRPIIPVLDGDAQPSDMSTAVTLATQRHRAAGLSWWRLGTFSPAGWKVINTPISVGSPTPIPGPEPTDNTGQEIIIRPSDAGFASGTYTGKPELEEFQGTWGWKVFYKNTEPQTSKVWARWSPGITISGRYEIAAFVPARHSTTTNARFKIANIKGSTGEILVNIDQSRQGNQWVTLGVFELDRATNGAGTVLLNDLTGETGKEIAFDALRWRQITTPTTPGGGLPTGTNLADGYDSPVGTDIERRGTQVWPSQWIDASPFAQAYFVGTPSEAYHTGADLNLPRDADAHSPVYSCANGVVTFASRLPTWGNVIIIKHDPLATNGKVLYSRYGHVENMVIKVGDRVKRGQQIAKVGNAFGRFAYHLHFDLSPTTILESHPEHWPAKNLKNLLANYIDPRKFIQENRPKS